jgi:predicted XRE-type DNA-binding protein
MSDETRFRRSSGNVFADLGLADADYLLAKADLAIEISSVIEERNLTQVEAASLMGVDQPKVSALVRGRLDGFSMERLYRFLNALGRDVEIIVRPTPETEEGPSLRVTRELCPSHPRKPSTSSAKREARSRILDR